MSTRIDLLNLLNNNYGTYLSGQQIGDSLNVSRNAIWKAIKQLQADGYNIESKSHIGYRLIGNTNMLTKAQIAEKLSVPCSLSVYDSVDSTNNLAKSIVVGDTPIAIVANKQTAGRGRLGRNFSSPAGSGLYLSIGFVPKFDLDKSLFVTMAAAVATCRAIEKVASVSCRIKWVNDIFYNDKKICGILTEAQSNFETGTIDKLIIGIGVNCFPGSFPESIKDIAGSISNEKNSFSRNDLAAEIINETISLTETLSNKEFFSEYRRKCFVLGKHITIHQNYNDEVGIKAKAIDIDNDGGLVVEYLEGPMSRQMATLTTGEISIKF